VFDSKSPSYVDVVVLTWNMISKGCV